MRSLNSFLHVFFLEEAYSVKETPLPFHHNFTIKHYSKMSQNHPPKAFIMRVHLSLPDVMLYEISGARCRAAKCVTCYISL